MGGPLAGVRVIDLTAVASGPMATMILGDQGADVVKVEPPAGGDLLRQIGSSRGGLWGDWRFRSRGRRGLRSVPVRHGRLAAPSRSVAFTWSPA